MDYLQNEPITFVLLKTLSRQLSGSCGGGRLQASIKSNSADKKQHKDRQFQTICSNFFSENGLNAI